MANYDVNNAKKKILRRLKRDKKKRRILLFGRMAIAASIVLLVGATFYLWQEKETTRVLNRIDQKQIIVTGSEKAILTLEDGNQVALEKGKEYQSEALSSNGEEIIYAPTPHDKKQNSKLEYKFNYITVPRGGQFFVQLSDGTKVWLNSDSKLKYPITFLGGKNRNVELLYGEAYFEVSPSNLNGGSLFRVISKSQNLKVLGTKFNIKAYDGERAVKTTLLEGKIALRKGDKKTVLEPNQQSLIGVGNDIFKVLEVDASQEISWVEGIFSFEQESLQDIMKSLSRWYDADIFFENEKLKKFKYSGILERGKSIHEILELLEASSDGAVSFEIKGKVIIVK